MFWENFWANFLSSLAAGIILGLLGLGIYYKKFYKKTIINKKAKLKNKYGSNTTIMRDQINNTFVNKQNKKRIKKYNKN